MDCIVFVKMAALGHIFPLDVTTVISGVEIKLLAIVVNVYVSSGRKDKKFSRRRQATEIANLTKTNVFSIE